MPVVNTILATTLFQSQAAFDALLHTGQADILAANAEEIDNFHTALGGLAFNLPGPAQEGAEDIGAKLLDAARTLNEMIKLDRGCYGGAARVVQLKYIADDLRLIPAGHFEEAVKKVLASGHAVFADLTDEMTYMENMAIDSYAPYAKAACLKLIDKIAEDPTNLAFIEEVKEIVRRVMRRSYSSPYDLVDFPHDDHPMFNLDCLGRVLEIYEKLAASAEADHYKEALNYLQFLCAIFITNHGNAKDLPEAWIKKLGEICPVDDFPSVGLAEPPTPAAGSPA